LKPLNRTRLNPQSADASFKRYRSDAAQAICPRRMCAPQECKIYERKALHHDGILLRIPAYSGATTSLNRKLNMLKDEEGPATR